MAAGPVPARACAHCRLRRRGPRSPLPAGGRCGRARTAAPGERSGHQGAGADLLLRHALAANAANAAGDGDFAPLAKDLEARFAAAARRGDRLHLREEARFRLLLPGEAGRALALAQQNWRSQREPEDARILLEAALAAGRPEAAAPVIGWLRATGLEDVRIQALVRRLEAATG